MADGDALPARIGRYQVQAEIGRGMMGVVYRALDPDLGRAVALKTVRLALAASGEERQAFERRFLAEARAVARLSHPGIIVIHDVGRDEATGTPYIALELLPGRTLAQLIAPGSPPLDWREALRLTARVSDALHHAHLRGIIHRDVKPANVMVLPSGEPKVMDFGIAKVPTEHLTATGQFFGTPSYMSPEQASGEALDGRSDLFSLGAVLYLLLTGRPAFQADSVAAILTRVLHKDPPSPSTLVPGLPPAVDGIVARALAKRPEDRYADANTFKEDIEDVLAGRSPRRAGAVPAAGAAEATLVSRAPVAPPEPSPAPLEPESPRTLPPVPAVSRRRLALAGFALVAAAGLLKLSGVQLRLFSFPTAVLPAFLEIDLRHSLKGGMLQVWIDGALVLEEPLESWVKEDLVVAKLRSGRERQQLQVPPGPHEIRVEVTGDGFSGARSLRGSFESGATRRLEAKVSGLLKKELSLWWGS